MTKYQVEGRVLIEVEINDDAVIRRCVENWNDENQPVEPNQGLRGWRDMFYDLHDEDDVVKHLAYALGVKDFRFKSLDGWADMDEDAAVGRLVECDFDWVTPILEQRD